MEPERSQNDSPAETAASRRHFFVGAIYGLGALIGSVLGVHAAIYLLIPAKMRGNDDWVEVGDIGKLTPDMPQIGRAHV